MKHIFAAFILFASTQTFASAADSVAVFFSAKKTVVLVNEHSPNRIHTWMDQLGAGSELHILNADHSIKIDCGRTETTASCTFRFLPSREVQFGHKSVVAHLMLNENVSSLSNFEFKSSRGDKFSISSNKGHLTLNAVKSN